MRIIIERLSVPQLREKLENAGFEVRDTHKLFVGGYEVGAIRPPIGMSNPALELETGWIPPTVLIGFITAIAKH